MLIKEFPFFTNDECNEIKQYAYKKEKELKDSDPNEKYNESITTNSYNQYNFFRDHPIYAERLVSFLNATKAPLEWPIMVQSWVNIYRKGDGIGWHKHRGDALSFNIFIDGDPEPGPAYILAGKVYEGLNEYEMKVKNYPNKTGYRILHRNNQFFTDYIFNTAQDCIETIEYIVSKPNQFIIRKTNKGVK